MLRLVTYCLIIVSILHLHQLSAFRIYNAVPEYSYPLIAGTLSRIILPMHRQIAFRIVLVKLLDI